MPEPLSREERDLENTPSIAIEGECYLVPGPVKMSNETLNSMSCPVMTARGTEFRDVMAELNGLLRIAFNLSHSNFERGTESFQGEDNYSIIIVSGSGTAAMEMVIANRFSKEDSLLVPTNGKFGERVAELANTFSQVNNLKFEWGQSFDLDVIEKELSTRKYSGLAFCHNETSTGITQDAEALGLLAKKYNVALILDGITSVGGLPVFPSKWGAEAVVVGAQKCTAGPSGIAAIAINNSFVSGMGERKNSGNGNPTYYLDLIPALKKATDDQTPWTPAINLALGWLTALRELKDEGLENRWNRCEKLSSSVQKLFSDLGFTLFAEEGHRSSTVTALLYPEGIDDKWRTRLANIYKTHVIGAQEHMKGKMFRIGSMGTTSIDEMIEGCKRMIACFSDFGIELPDLNVESYFQ
jgi:aspartate aminotransferase-like enzyme